jgi:hypothetical protein
MCWILGSGTVCLLCPHTSCTSSLLLLSSVSMHGCPPAFTSVCVDHSSLVHILLCLHSIRYTHISPTHGLIPGIRNLDRSQTLVQYISPLLCALLRYALYSTYIRRLCPLGTRCLASLSAVCSLCSTLPASRAGLIKPIQKNLAVRVWRLLRLHGAKEC